jgi:hypothetical protein
MPSLRSSSQSGDSLMFCMHVCPRIHVNPSYLEAVLYDRVSPAISRRAWRILGRPVSQSSTTISTHEETRMRNPSSLALLSPSNQAIARARLKEVLDTYIHHRPTVQRLLTAGFVLYCLGTTYRNLSGTGAKGGARERVSRKGKPQGR